VDQTGRGTDHEVSWDEECAMRVRGERYEGKSLVFDGDSMASVGLDDQWGS
jgi:hypothetical protein